MTSAGTWRPLLLLEDPALDTAVGNKGKGEEEEARDLSCGPPVCALGGGPGWFGSGRRAQICTGAISRSPEGLGGWLIAPPSKAQNNDNNKKNLVPSPCSRPTLPRSVREPLPLLRHKEGAEFRSYMGGSGTERLRCSQEAAG